MYNCFDTFPDCNHINNITCEIYILMHFITLIRISLFSKQTTNCIAVHADNSRIICASTLSHWSCILAATGSLILNVIDTYYQLFLILKKKTVAQISDSKLDVPIKFDMTCPDCSSTIFDLPAFWISPILLNQNKSFVHCLTILIFHPYINTCGIFVKLLEIGWNKMHCI